MNKKAYKRLYFFKQLKRANLSTEELVKFYVTCIQSVILYAYKVYHYTQYSGILKQVTRTCTKESFAYIMYGYDYSYTELLSQSKLTTLSKQKPELCSKFFDKIMSNPQNSSYNYIARGASFSAKIVQKQI